MPTRPRRTARRSGPLLMAVAVMAIAAAAAMPPSAALADPAASGAAAAGAWLAHELDTNGHQLANVGSIDWGLTADAALAVMATVGPTDPAAQATVANVGAHLASYSTWDDLGAAYAGVRLAGPTAKTLYVSLVAGAGPVASGVDLDAELRSLLVVGGAQAGRFADRNPYSGDTSNGFGQALAILALARTAVPAPAAATTFLLHQQCPGGGFRLTYFGAAGCTDDSQADSDATALAVQALAVVDQTTAVTDAVAHALTWILSVQDASSGSFGGAGPTSAANANSTGLLAQTLRANGQTTAADRAAAWVAALQRATQASDAGAIAYNPAGAADGANGIPANARDQWRRSTSQALLAFGVGPLSTIGLFPTEPATTVQPGSTTTSTSTTSTSTSRTTTSTSTTTTSTSTTTSTTTTTTTTVAPSPTSPDAAVIPSVLDASTTRGAAATPMAVTGRDARPLVVLGVGLFIAGLTLELTRRRRTGPA